MLYCQNTENLFGISLLSIFWLILESKQHFHCPQTLFSVMFAWPVRILLSGSAGILHTTM